jgi:hypothetical protein
MTKHIGLSAKTDQWFTPPEVMIRVQMVFQGSPSLDPCGSLESNKVVQADRVITKNSLDVPWPSCESVFCNPPSGKYCGTNPRYKGMSNPSAFYHKLDAAYVDCKVSEYIFLGYSIEQLQTLQTHNTINRDALICIPKKRIRFVDQAGNRNSPTHANFILYRGENSRSFEEAFEDYGIILNR